MSSLLPFLILALYFCRNRCAPAFASVTKPGQSLDNLYQDEIFALLQVYHLLKDIVFALHNHSGLKVVTAEIFNGLSENSILLKRVIGAAFGSMLLLLSAVFSGDNIGLNDSNGRFLRRHVTDDFHERILRQMVDCFILRTDVLYTVRDAKSFTSLRRNSLGSCETISSASFLSMCRFGSQNRNFFSPRNSTSTSTSGSSTMARRRESTYKNTCIRTSATPINSA